MQFDPASSVVGFLVGAAAGAAATYFGNKYTDRRREQEAAKRAEKDFLKVKEGMPLLIAEMKADLTGKDGTFIREFFVLPNRRVRLGGSEKPRFIFYEDQHDGLRSQLTVLENMRYIVDVTPKNTPIYRMTEEFVDLVCEYG